jgi:hypothetical protein
MEATPFCCHATVAALSDKLWTVWERTSQCCAKTSNCAMVAANYKSLLVMVLVGFEVETSFEAIDVGNLARQSNGTTSPFGRGTKCTPPEPFFEASHAPLVDGSASGISLSIAVGWAPTSSTSQWKSCRKAWVWEVRRTRAPSLV